MQHRGSIVVILLCAVAILTLNACTGSNPTESLVERRPSTMVAAPTPDHDKVQAYPAGQVKEGKYLVELMGCGTCHTDGAMVGEPDMSRRLAGSRIGIAYTNPLENDHPGVAYPSNLTPDPKTGLGDWSEQQVIEAIRHGVGVFGQPLLTVMPWPAYALLSKDDATAIASYLRSLPPVEHKVPENVAEGSKAVAPFVYFGVYQSRD